MVPFSIFRQPRLICISPNMHSQPPSLKNKNIDHHELPYFDIHWFSLHILWLSHPLPYSTLHYMHLWWVQTLKPHHPFPQLQIHKWDTNWKSTETLSWEGPPSQGLALCHTRATEKRREWKTWHSSSRRL
jgi:hypothetical protein